MSSYTNVLFARPSFVEGFARVFDFGGALNQYNISETPAEADYLALKADWLAILDDLRVAAAKIVAESEDGE